MRKTAYLFFLLPLFVSCAHSPVPKYIKKQQFSYCYDEKNTGIDSLINIEGYYTEKIIGKNDLFSKVYHSNREATMDFMNFMFYKNGICVFGFHNYGDSISSLFKEMRKVKEKHYYYKGPTNLYWGVYRIYRDTIKLQVINRPSLMSPTWMAFEEWYKIIDKNTLQLVVHRRLDIDIENQGKDFQHPLEIVDTTKVLPAKFESLEVIPYSEYNWLLKKKWFWCDKQAYKAWRKGRKESRK